MGDERSEALAGLSGSDYRVVSGEYEKYLEKQHLGYDGSFKEHLNQAHKNRKRNGVAFMASGITLPPPSQRF